MEEQNVEQMAEVPEASAAPEAPKEEVLTSEAEQAQEKGISAQVKKIPELLKKIPKKEEIPGLLKKVPKLAWIIAAVAVLVAIALPVVGAMNNTYKTPLNLTCSLLSKQPKDIADAMVKQQNGWVEKETKALLKALEKSEYYEEMIEDLEDGFEWIQENLEEEYGEGYKISYKVEEKEKLEKADLRDFRDGIKEMGNEILDLVEEAEDFDSDEWEDFADEYGMSKSEAKKLVKALEDIGRALKNVEVTAGYELEVVQYANGEEVDSQEMEVYKVDGRWICMESATYYAVVCALEWFA